MPRRKCTTRRGVALIWVALTLFAMIALTGLAMDLSIVVLGKQQLQHGADAAALAGAALVRADQDSARQAAQTLGLANRVYSTEIRLDLNQANDADGDIIIGYYDRKTSSFEAARPGELSQTPNAVRILARRTTQANGEPIPLVFGPMAGVSGVDVTCEAIAMVGGGTGAGFLVLNGDAYRAADFRGNVTIDVTDITVDPPVPGKIKINSDNAEAVYANGSVVIEAGEIEVYGDANIDGADFEGELDTGSSPVPDPLAYLDPIVPGPDTPVRTSPPPKDNLTIQPGYYPNGIERSKDMLTLESGIYILGGAGFQLTGTGGVSSQPGGGVLLYVETPGVLELNGTGGAKLDPLNAPAGTWEADYNGITIFQARDNLSEAVMGGGSGLDLKGTLYFPSNLVEIHGGGAGYGNQLIVNKVRTVGEGEIKIAYDGRFPALGNNVFLVR